MTTTSACPHASEREGSQHGSGGHPQLARSRHTKLDSGVREQQEIPKTTILIQVLYIYIYMWLRLINCITKGQPVWGSIRQRTYYRFDRCMATIYEVEFSVYFWAIFPCPVGSIGSGWQIDCRVTSGAIWTHMEQQPSSPSKRKLID